MTEKIIPEMVFDRMYDFLKQSKEEWHSGTDEKGDYIVHDGNKYYCQTAAGCSAKNNGA